MDSTVTCSLEDVYWHYVGCAHKARAAAASPPLTPGVGVVAMCACRCASAHASSFLRLRTHMNARIWVWAHLRLSGAVREVRHVSVSIAVSVSLLWFRIARKWVQTCDGEMLGSRPSCVFCRMIPERGRLHRPKRVARGPGRCEPGSPRGFGRGGPTATARREGSRYGPARAFPAPLRSPISPELRELRRALETTNSSDLRKHQTAQIALLATHLAFASTSKSASARQLASGPIPLVSVSLLRWGGGIAEPWAPRPSADTSAGHRLQKFRVALQGGRPHR